MRKDLGHEANNNDVFVPDMKDYEKIIQTGLERLKHQNYDSWNMLIKLCFDNPYRNKKSGSPSRQRSIGQNSNVNPVELMRFHPVLNKLAIGTVKLLLEDAKLVKMNPNTLLFGHDEPNTNWYFILFGTLVLHHEELGALGVLTIEHTVGEESIIKGERKKLDASYS